MWWSRGYWLDAWWVLLPRCNEYQVRRPPFLGEKSEPPNLRLPYSISGLRAGRHTGSALAERVRERVGQASALYSAGFYAPTESTNGLHEYERGGIANGFHEYESGRAIAGSSCVDLLGT
eukprot:2156012-Amphidinium_carterae.1